MSGRFVLFYVITLISIFSIYSCKGKVSKSKPKVIDSLEESKLLPKEPEKIKVIPNNKIKAPEAIIGDTVWIYPYTTNLWTDTIETKGYKAILSAKIDTNDYIIDTIETSQGGRIKVGYNHLYMLDFTKNNKPWFTVQFNKKDQLEPIIGGTDFWLESNLNVFHNLVYNNEFGKFTIEFDINLKYNNGSVYYFVFDTLGNIDYTGTAGSWGGGDVDGAPFLTSDNRDYITGFEIYNFKSDSAINVSEFATLAEIKTYGKTVSNFHWLYAMRYLTKNNILFVFDREGNEPENNAIILNTDTIILSKFRYYGLVVEMDAMLLFKYDEKLKKYFIFDTEREILICINETDPSVVKEIGLGSMLEVDGDTIPSAKYTLIGLDTFGSYRFYKNENDTNFYYDIEKFE